MDQFSKKITVAVNAFVLFLSLPVMADAFIVKDIRVEGLQRISAGTVFNYLPLQIDQRLDTDNSGELIRALYKTGFFKDVRLERQGNVLIVSVIERPAIASIDVTGNKSLETEQLTIALKDIGLAEGRVFNRSILDKIEQELKRQYYSQGKYSMKLVSSVVPLERNRVAVKIEITEGENARIKKINILGNDHFEVDELIEDFQLQTTGFLSFLTKDDQYSRQKLSGDLEALRSYYLDRGHLNFKIDSTQVSITPNKRDIYITINISEGEVYTIGDIKLAGEMMVPKEEIFPLIHLIRGEVFSRKQVVGSSERITAYLGDNGYAFANVNNIPEIDAEAKEVDVTFFVDPGKRVYVRRINMQGNSYTRDEVLRRELRQLESAWFSPAQVRRSRLRLQRLGYFDEVNVETPEVPNSEDQVDVEIGVKEKPMGNLMAGLGFSQSQGLVFSTSISQDNFLGSGKRVSLAFDNSSSNTHYQLAYNNPYYTIDGISRGFNLNYKKTDFDRVDTARYIVDTGVAGVNFGIPVTETNRIRFSFDFVNSDYKLGSDPSDELAAFEENNGDRFLDFRLGTSWTHDSRNSAIMPTTGGLQSFSALATLPGSDLEYYKINIKRKQYLPLSKTFTLALNGDIGYGEAYGATTALPLWENYFAGGSKTVRGFKDFSLGPRDTTDDPLGGNLRLAANAEILFPPPFKAVEKTVRVGLFADAGQVWDISGNDDFDIADIRYSTGVSVFWLSPIGALGASYGFPLNDESDDEVERFQFTIGTTF